MSNELTIELLDAVKAIQPYLGDILYMGDREVRAELIERLDLAVEALTCEYPAESE